MMRALVVAVAALSLGFPTLTAGSSPPPVPAKRDAGLERGIRHVEAGEWNEALKDLSDAVRRLSRDPGRKHEAAEACLYSGLAYIGLGDTSPAISQFAQALMRNPQIKVPPGRDSQAALDAFEVARREAVAPPEPKAGGRSQAPFVIAGVASAGAGVALAAGGGGGASGDNPNSLPRSFTVTGATGAPQLLIQNATPPSSSTIHLMQTAPILTFAFLNDASLPSRVHILVELLGPSGLCMTGNSEIAVVDRSVTAYSLVVASWRITCPVGFTTLSLNARLVDADANIPISLTSFSGGYLFLN